MNIYSREKILTFAVTKMEVLRLPQPQDVLSMFLNVGHFSASCSYNKGSYKKERISLCGDFTGKFSVGRTILRHAD